MLQEQTAAASAQGARRTRKKMKIARVSIVDQVCSAIKQDIADGLWKPGDKIPSESEFAETFGVNRLSVRMALQKLNTLGIIETRVGEGSFVCDFSLKPILDEILAVQTGTDEEKAQLKAALDRHKQCSVAYEADPYSEELLAAAVEADFNFHYQVIRMSHNKLYKDIYYMVQQLIREHITQLVSSRVHRRHKAGLPPLSENDTHVKIYNCIINSDIDALRRANEEMLGIVPVAGMDFFE